MPWVLNAAFKIIKSWLPAKAIPKIKNVNKNNLKEFVEPNIALRHWGGNSDYTFTYVPEARAALVNGTVENGKKVLIPLCKESLNVECNKIQVFI